MPGVRRKVRPSDSIRRAHELERDWPLPKPMAEAERALRAALFKEKQQMEQRVGALLLAELERRR